jgi:DNA helicase-4
LEKETKAHNEEERNIILYSSKHQNNNGGYLRYYDEVAEHCMKKVKEIHDTKGCRWGDIMILRRINPAGSPQTLALQRKAKELLGFYLSEDVHNPNTVSLLTVHKSKGMQAKIVFILNVDKGLYGFPNELQNPDILEPATRGKKGDREEEERRLFYVAVTRAKEDVIMYHQKCAKSKFLDEIKEHIVEKDIE